MKKHVVVQAMFSQQDIAVRESQLARAWIETIDGTLYNHAGRPINAFKEELAEYMKIKR